jgi:hypothetical protein
VHNENEYLDMGAMDASSNSHVNAGSESVVSRNEPIGYFPPVPLHMPNHDTGYFPPMSSSFAAEILRDKAAGSPEEQDNRVKTDAVGSRTSSETDPEVGEGASSSEATSWHTSDDLSVSDRSHKWAGNEEVFDDVEDDPSNSKRLHSRTHSLSSPSKKPAFVQRSDSDPIVPHAEDTPSKRSSRECPHIEPVNNIPEQRVDERPPKD